MKLTTRTLKTLQYNCMLFHFQIICRTLQYNCMLFNFQIMCGTLRYNCMLFNFQMMCGTLQYNCMLFYVSDYVPHIVGGSLAGIFLVVLCVLIGVYR